MELTVIIDKHKGKILNAAVIIFAVIIANNIYRNQLNEINSLREKKEMELKKKDILGDFTGLESKLNAYKELLGKRDLSVVINDINAIAKSSNVKIISIKPSEEESYPEYVKFPFELVVTTVNYHALGKFVSALENSSIVFLVEGVNVRSESDTEGKAEILNANLRISNIAFLER